MPSGRTLAPVAEAPAAAVADVRLRERSAARAADQVHDHRDKRHRQQDAASVRIKQNQRPKPAANDPASPIAIVWHSDIGSGPGRASRANAPTSDALPDLNGIRAKTR
jgi:hypothetical protein